MISVRLVCAESYQAAPIPGLDPTYSEFRGSEVKHVPVIRIFGSTACGQKTCLHIHGVFPYMYIPYAGGENSHSLAYRLAASLDAAINVSLGAASCHNQHVFKVQLVSGIPLYGYHEKEHQFFKVYFYNPAMIKRAANLLQNGAVLSGNFQPYEAHIPYIQQFMIDFNLHGMNMVDLRCVKHRVPTKTALEIDLSSVNSVPVLDNVEYLPDTIRRQSTCKLEIDALASDVLNRHEIESEIVLNPGLATIWEEEKARRLQLNLSGGDSQLVNPKSPTRSSVVTENDLYQQQRLANRLSTISQEDVTNSLNESKNPSSYPLETGDDCDVTIQASRLEHHVKPCSTENLTKVPQHLRDLINSNATSSLLLSTTPNSHSSLDCSILDADDIPVIDILNELANDNGSESAVDDNSLLGSQQPEAVSQAESDTDLEENEDLNLTSLQLNSLSLTQHSRLSQKSKESKASNDQKSASNLLRDLSVFDMDTDNSSDGSICDNIPQYDGAGDTMPTVLKSDKKASNSGGLNHLSAKRSSFEIISPPACNVNQCTKISRIQTPSCSSNVHTDIDFDLDLPVSLQPSHYLDNSNDIFNERFTQLYEDETNFDSDLENLQSTMEIGMLSPNPEEAVELNNQSIDDKVIPIDKVLTGDPCFTESAVFDKSDITELQDQYVSLLGNALLPPIVHNGPYINSLNAARPTEIAEISNDDDKRRKSSFPTKLVQNSIENRCVFPLENITPNIQNLNNQMQVTPKVNAAENCKDIDERLTPPDSDYNCNVVATWEELQNFRFPERQTSRRKCPKKNDSETLVNRQSDIVRPSSKRIRTKKEMSALLSQPNQIDTQALHTKYNYNSSVKPAIEEKNYTELEAIRNNANRRVYTHKKTIESIPVKVGKNQSYSSYKFYKSKNFAENRLRQPKINNSKFGLRDNFCLSNKQSSRQHKVTTLPDIVDINVYAAGDERRRLPGVTYPSHPVYGNQSVVESILADFILGQEDELPLTAIDSSSKNCATDTSNLISYYSSETSHNRLASGGMDHNHATYDQRGKLSPQSVYRPNHLWVIEKRKRGRKKESAIQCNNPACELPIVLIKKLEMDNIPHQEMDVKLATKLEKNNRIMPVLPKSSTDIPAVREPREYAHKFKTSPTKKYQKCSSSRNQLFYEFDEESSNNPFKSIEDIELENRALSPETKVKKVFNGSTVKKDLSARLVSCRLKKSNCSTSESQYISNKSSPGDYASNTPTINQNADTRRKNESMKMLSSPILRKIAPIRNINGLQNGKTKLVVLTIKNTFLNQEKVRRLSLDDPSVKHDHLLTPTKCEFSKITNFDADHHVANATYKCNTFDKNCVHPAAITSRNSGRTPQNNLLLTPELLLPNNQLIFARGEALPNHNSNICVIRLPISQSSKLNTQSEFVATQSSQSNNHCSTSISSESTATDTHCFAEVDRGSEKKSDAELANTLSKWKIMLDKRTDDKVNNSFSTSFTSQSFLSEKTVDDKYTPSTLRDEITVETQLKTNSAYDEPNSLHSNCIAPVHITRSIHRSSGTPYVSITSEHESIGKIVNSESIDTYANVNDMVFNANEESNRALNTFEEPFAYSPPLSEGIPSTNIDSFNSSILDGCSPVIQTFESTGETESQIPTNSRIEDLTPENPPNLEFTKHNLLNNDCKTCFSPSREYAVDAITSEIPKCLFEEDSSSEEEKEYTERDDIVEDMDQKEQFRNTEFVNSLDCLPDHKNLDVFDIDNISSDTFAGNESLDVSSLTNIGDELPKEVLESSPVNDRSDQFATEYFDLKDMDIVYHSSNTVANDKNTIVPSDAYERAIKSANAIGDTKVDENAENFNVLTVNAATLNMIGINSTNDHDDRSSNLSSIERNNESNEDHRVPTLITQIINSLEEDDEVQNSNFCTDRTIESIGNIASQFDNPLSEVTLNLEIDTNSNITKKCADLRNTRHKNGTQISKINNTRNTAVHEDNQNTVFPKDSSNIESASDTILRTGANESSDCPSTEAADNTKSTTLHSSEQKSAIGGSEEITSQKNDLRVTTETMANVSDATMFQGSQNDSSVAENEDIALQETVLRIINETNTNMCDVSQISSDQCNVRDTNDIQPKTFPGVQSVESVPENMEITSREKPLDTTNVMNATDDAATTLADIRKDAAVEDNDEIVSRDVFNVTNETNINTVVADTKSTYDENTENIGIHSATISQETQNNSSVEEKTVTVSGNVSRTETNANSEGVEKITSVDKKITNSLTMENSVEERNDNSVTRRHKRAYKLVSIQLEKIDLSKLNCHLTSIIKTQELHTPISEDKESQIQTGPIKSGTNGVCKNWTNKSANGKRVRFDDNIVWILENGRVVNSDQKSLTVPVSLLDDNPLLRQIKTRHSAGSSGKCSEKKKMLLLPKHKSQISVNSSDDSAAGTTIDDAAPRMDAISSVLENWSSAYKKIVSEKINSPPLSVDNCLTQYTKKVQLIRPDPKLLMVKLTCNETRWTNLRRKQKYMLQLGLYRTDLKNLICYSKPPTTAFIQLKLPRVVLKRLKPEVIKKYEPKQNITDTENPRKSLRQRRKTTCLPNIPAYDGAADCSSDDSDLDPDETVERQEKRICDYKPSAKKNPTKLIDLTPKKRHRTSDDSALQSASKHRKTDHLSPKIPDRSEKKSDLLSSPGCPSRSYSPLNIVITSPRIRNNPEQTNSPRSMKSLRKNADTIQTTPRRRHRQLREKLYENLSARPLQSKETDETVKDGPNGSELLGELLAIPSTSGLNTSRRCTDDFISATGSGQISCDDTGATIKSRNDVKKRLEFSFRKDNRTGKSRTLYMFDDDDTTSTSYKHGYDSVDMEHVERESGVGLENVDRNISKCLQDSSGRSVGITDNKSSDKPTVDKTVNDSCFKEDDDDTTDGDDNKPNKISASGYDRQKLTDNSDDEDENINLCNVTFTQYVETQRIENAQYHITAKRRGEGEREIVVKPRFNPPNSRQIAESMETFNIPVCRNEKPFFSNHHDVMNQKEVAHQMLNVPSKSMLNLPTFKSDLDSVTGIRRWRIMRVKEVYPTGINIKPSEMRQRLTGQNKIVIRPLRSPPALKSVKTWLRAKQYLKKNNEPKNLVAKNADSDPTCSGESASSEESISVVIQDSLQRDIFLHPKTGTQLTSRYVIAESGIPKMKNSEDSQQSNKSNVSIDASLRKALEDSNLFKNQDTSKHFPFTFGQIESSSQADQFKIPCKNLQELKPITTHQFLTILCLEVHVVTRGDLLPNPQYDAISAIFYAIQNDVPATSTLKALDYGIVVRDPEFDTTRARGYLKGAGVTCTIHYAANEEALFEKLVAIIQDCDPDILIGWELECLSWGYVFQRAAALGINLAPRASRIPTVQQAWENQTTELNILTEIKMPGRIVLDIWRLMRHELALQSYTFENVTYHVMRERLSCPSFATLTRWWGHRTPRIRWMVVDHYSKKVVGILKLLEHLDVIGKTSELARIYGIQFFEVFSRGSQFQVESVMLRLAKPANYVPVSPSVQQRASMRAPESLPLIMEPESVFYSDPLIVLDFQSLYPSIIIAHNYCYSTCLGRIENIGQPDPFEFGAATLKVTKQTALKLKGKLNFSPCGVAYVKPEVRKGILPRMLTEMIETRLMVKKAMKDHSKADQALQRALFSRQLGLKLLANVTFGYTHANFSGRMPCIEIGDSIVSKARETLERAITLIESNRKWNVRVVYGDTDSLFILLPGKSRKEAFEVGTEIANAVTADNPTPMKLKLEKIMQPSILQTKKRYCGYMYESPDQETPTYLAKGIETVRRDGCPAVSKVIDLKQYGGSEMLEKTLRILFDTKDVSLIKNYVTRQLDKVLRGRVSIQDLTFAREFRGLQGYKSSACVPALELTQRLMIKDPRAVPRTSERVPYVIVAGAPNQPLFQCVRSPWEVLTDPGLRPNSLYYITRVIIPPLNRCLNLIGVDANIWFAEMPHRQIAQYSHTSRNDVQKSTISQYFGTVACAVCSNTSKAGICIDCLTLPNETLVILHEKIRQMDRAYSNIHLVCRSCIGRADNIDCTSLNCPVLYRRLQAENDRHHMYYIREIIEKGNSLEF